MKTGLLLACFLCLLGSSPGAEPLKDEGAEDGRRAVEEVLARVEGKVSAMRTLRGNFIQEKHLAVLDQPLVLKGTIFMQKPDLFAWHVEEPLRYSMVIQGEVVRQWDEDTERVQEMSLSKNPMFRVAIQQMRDWFSGAYRSMLGEYSVRIVEEDPVSLRFIPLETAFASQVVESVTVVFESDERYVRQIHIVEKGGDSTLLTFVDTLLNTSIAPSAWKLRRESAVCAASIRC
jgi:outer membrane lipoprotein-sorting protein